MSTADTRTLRPQVRDRAQGRCEYCHLPEEVDFVRYEVDHVIAEQHGGKTDLDNLAYACFECNRQKGPNLASLDPQTGERAWLYNPRTQNWADNFRLDDSGTISGLTAEGRATVSLLAFNDPERVQDRKELIELGKLIPQGVEQ
ncbi:MAG: HNH endonuclease [Candidatus Binatia bacterium]